MKTILMRAAPKCIVCLRPVVTYKGSMCTNCCEAYDRMNVRDSTTLGVIRWAAGRARRMQKKELMSEHERWLTEVRCAITGAREFIAQEKGSSP